ncbi:MAG: NADH-quinone oxidoreductase subunit, partial [Dehalococcoidia bacterium]|nr:NADH-quinone oxidoreductase subunit [Dehalococcoidia bacterium]
MDIRLLSPEIALSVAAALVLLLDLVLERKGALPAVSLLGILAAAFFSLTLAGNGGTSFAGTLVVDDFSVIFKLLFLGITALVVLSSVEYASRFHAYQGEYYGILLLSCVGMMLMASTGELISIYVALELTGIALFILSGFL